MDNDLAELEREPDTDRAVSGSDDGETQDPSARSRGLLDLKPRKLARLLWKRWKNRDRELQPKVIRWAVNQRRREGKKFVGMVKNEDQATYRIYTPPDSARVPPSMSVAPRLCRRLTAQMFQDPPLPEAVPSRDDDEARDAASLSAQILTNMGSEAGTNGLRSARRAFDKLHAAGSGFRYHYVDPEGGGAAPKTILASTAAETEDQAIERTETVLDMTGMPVTRTVALPEPYVPRYVRPDGTLTDRQDEADEVWLPRICHEVHTGKTLRFHPITANDISQAEMVQLLAFRSWSRVKAEFPEVLKLAEDRQKKLATWRPEGIKDYLPTHLTEEDLTGTESEDRPGGQAKISDDAICILLITYCRAGGETPDGLYAVSGGGNISLLAQDWRYENEETGKIEPLDLPVDQFKGWDEGSDDQYAFGPMDRLGDGDELIGTIDSSRIMHFNRLGARRTFLPNTSSLTTRSLAAPTGSIIPYSGGKPEFEEVPEYPRDTIELRNQVRDEMVDESGVQPAMQGQDTPNIQSGFHAVQMIEQGLSGLADLRENAADALERGWRIDLQLVRAFFTGVHLLREVGINGAVKLKHWTAADLGDTSDVRLLRGTFSMMTPSMKSGIALAMSQNGLLSKEALSRSTEGNTGGLAALRDDPHTLRVRRQIEFWEEGPQKLPDGAPDPASASPFDYRPVDDQLDIAPLRMVEIGRAMSSTRYMQHPPTWQGYLVNEYNRAKMAAGGTPLPPPGAPVVMDPAAQGTTPGARPLVPPIVGQPANAIGARQPDAAMAGLTQAPVGGAPLLEGGEPRLDGTPLPAPSTTLPL